MINTATMPRVGYVVKRYPRFSETFIVTEILAHEAAGLDMHIFALSASQDTHFQDCLSRVRAPVHYLNVDGSRPMDFWNRMQSAAALAPDGFAALEAARGEPARDVQQACLLATMIRQFDIEHLHAHFATSAANVARMAAGFTQIPWTMTAHAKDIFHESVRPDDLRRKLTSASATVTVSDFNVAHLRDTCGDDASRVTRIYNGMDLAALPFDPPRQRKPAIISVGRLVEKKGFDDLIRACAILAEAGEEFTCVITGTGEQEAALRELIAQSSLQDRVELIGPRPQREVFDLIANAAVFAAPCVVGNDGNRDGLPTVLLEAMALGTPCISTDVTGIPEIVRDGETGLLVPQRNPQALARAMRRLLHDAKLRTILASAARSLVEARFDCHQNTAALRAIFQSVKVRRAAASGIAAPQPLEVA